MKTAIYIRVSTEEQASEGYSIDAQKARAIEYCNKHGYDVVGYYIDEGISGKDLKRPKMQELIADVKKGKVKIVVVYKLDRVTRSLRDLANLMDLLDRHGATIKSTSEELDISSLSGRAMVQMLGVFAEFERGTIAERVAMGREQRAREGLYAAPGRMFGYNYDKTTQLYTINEEEAAIVREMFELHQSGKGVDAIAKTFNEKGYKSRDGGQFNRHFVKRAFVNGWYYCGKFKYTTTDGEELLITAKNIPEPILSEKVFRRSNKIYGAKALDTAKKHGDDSYVFKGKLRCSYCGILMTSNTSARRVNKDASDKVYRYYRCYRRREGRCISRYWLSTKVDEAFKEFLDMLAESSNTIDIELKSAQKEKILETKDLAEKRLEKELDKRKRLQLLLLDETLSKEDFLELSNDIEKIIETIKSEINYIDKQIKDIDEITDFEAERKIASDMVDKWSHLSDIQKKEFLRVFVKSIYIDRKKITKVEFIT